MEDSFFRSEILSEFEEADIDYQSGAGACSNSSSMDYEPSVADSDDVSDSNNAVDFSIQEMDLAEEQAIDEFMRKTCQCHFGLSGRPCSCQFTRESIETARMNSQEMTKKQRDLIILGHLEANRHCFEDKEQSRFSITYWFHGYKVCKMTYLFLHCVGEKHYKNLVTHFSQNGSHPWKY